MLMVRLLLVLRLCCHFGQILDVLLRWTTDHDKYGQNNGLSLRRRNAILVSFNKDFIELIKAKAQLRA